MSAWTRFARLWRETPTARRSKSLRPRFVPRLEGLEKRELLASTIIAAFGAGPGGGPQVTVVFDDETQSNFYAFDPGFLGGVSATLGNINGTGIPDVVVGAGPGGGSQIVVFDGASIVAGTPSASASFLAFAPEFNGGVTLATGRINGTSHDDVVVGAGPGGGPNVKVFDGAQLALGTAAQSVEFMAFNATFTGGVIVATGGINGTGHDDVIVAAGPGGRPSVLVYDGATLAQGQTAITAAFFAFAAGFTGGVTLATGHIIGTSNADLVIGAGPGGGPQVEVFDGALLVAGNTQPSVAFMAFDPSFTGGVSIAVGNLNGTGHDDIVVGAGPGGGSQVNVYDGASLNQGNVVVTSSFMAFDPSFTGGVEVGIAHNPITGQNSIIAVAGPGAGPHVLIFNNTVVVTSSFYCFSPFFTGGVCFGPYWSPFYSPLLFSPFFGFFGGGWLGLGYGFYNGPFFGDPIGYGIPIDTGFFDPFDPFIPEFDPYIFDPGFDDIGVFDPGAFDSFDFGGFDGFDPGFGDFGGFDPGFTDFGGFDFGGFDGGFSDFGGFGGFDFGGFGF